MNHSKKINRIQAEIDQLIDQLDDGTTKDAGIKKQLSKIWLDLNEFKLKLNKGG